MPVAVCSNLNIRSSAYHVFGGPAPDILQDRICSFRYLLPSESSFPSSEVQSVPLSPFPSLKVPGSGPSALPLNMAWWVGDAGLCWALENSWPLAH